MLDLALLIAVLLYSVVASQPFFYLLALGRVSDALSGSAYVELRQQMNATMNARVPRLYAAALASTLLVVVAAVARGDGCVAVASAIAAAGLVVDLGLALRGNVPINRTMDGWSVVDYPADWATYRARWRAAFAVRQVVLGVGFVSLLLGAVTR